jgi:hypothetical protein
MKKRILSAIVAVVMIVAMLPVMTNDTTVSGAEMSGTLRGGLVWELADGVLTISGEGEMPNDTSPHYPWRVHRDLIESVVIGEDVTSIGRSAFNGHANLQSVTLPASITHIGSDAFRDTPWLTTQPNGAVYYGDMLIAWNGREFPENAHYRIKDGTRVVGSGALGRSSGTLKLITVPSSVTHIGSSAFGMSANGAIDALVIFESPVPPLSSASSGLAHLQRAYVPHGSAGAYRELIGHRNYNTIIEFCPVDCTRFSGSCVCICRCGNMNRCDECSRIPSARGNFTCEIGISYTFVDDYRDGAVINVWQRDAPRMPRDVVIPSEVEGRRVTAIVQHAFGGQNITSITIPASVTRIGVNAVGYSITQQMIGWETIDPVTGQITFHDDMRTDINKIEGFIIYGYSGTVAERYARENGFTFVALETPGFAEIGDALAILRYIINLPNEIEVCVSTHDFDGNGELEIADALLVLRGLIGLGERQVLRRA